MSEMSQPVADIAIFGNRHQESHLRGLTDLFGLLAETDFSVAVNSRFYDYLVSKGIELPPNCRMVEEIPASVQALISIGGDGTILRAAQWIGSREIPILCINTGTLGFLSNYTLAEASELLEELRSGDLLVESRSVLKVSGDEIPSHISPYALNEVAILKDETSSMINVHTSLDGYFLADYRADGLLIATPTGSTAYNLSLGGPIVQPTVSCRVISPVAPHSLTMRPLVVDAVSLIEALTTSRAQTYRVSLDGRSFVMKCGSSIRITPAPFKVKLMHRRSYNFASALRKKLYWASR